MKKVVLTGLMRSGTTLLGNLLNANEECVFLRDVFTTIFRMSRKLAIRSFREELSVKTKNTLLFRLKEEMVSFGGTNNLNNLQKNQFTTLEELFDLAAKQLVDSTTNVFGVKITEVEEWLEDLLENTEIHVIYLVRDLRDVLLSSANAFVDYNRTYYSRKWSKKVTKALKFNNPKIIIVKFEDLILKPERELERLSAFLGVSLSAATKELTDVSGLTWVDNSSFHDVKKLFDSVVVNRWKKNLKSKEVIYGSVVYKKLTKKLGYEENKQPFFKSLGIKIEHNLPFPRTRSRIMKKIKELIVRNER